MKTSVQGLDLSQNYGVLDLRSELVIDVDWSTEDEAGVLCDEPIKGVYPACNSDGEELYKFGVLALDQHGTKILLSPGHRSDVFATRYKA